MLRTVTLRIFSLLNEFEFEADCTISQVDHTASDSLKATVHAGDRVCKVAGEAVFQRSSLLAALDGKGPEDQVEVELMAASGEDSTLNGSVLFDGKDCFVAVRKKEAPKDELEVSSESSEDDHHGEGTRGSAEAASSPKTMSSPVDTLARQNSRPVEGLPATAHASMLANFKPGVAKEEYKPEQELRTALERGINKVEAGQCLILLSDPDVSPLAEIENLSASKGLETPTVVDFGLRLKNRISDSQLVDALRATLTKGSWFVVERATKSIHLLDLVATLLEECWNNDLKGVSPNSRILIITEPHPHFPPFLAKSAVTVRVKKSMARSQVLFESILNTSTFRLAAIQAAAGQLGDAAADPSAKDTKKVRISCAVNVVDIESREVFEDQNVIGAQMLNKDTAGTVKLRHTASALPNDKFFALARAGPKRFAAGSSLGNLYVVDDKGAALLSAHVHNASLWDCDFYGKSQFATAAEDCTAVSWKYDSENNVERVTTVRGPRDMYCVRYTGDGAALVSGGLDPQMIIRTLSGSTNTTRVPLSGSVQAMATRGASCVVIGGGEGSAYVVDIACQKVSQWKGIHAKKVPSLCINGDTLITGSFDATAKLWDLRKGCDAPIHSLKFKQYVTGLDSDGNYMAGCVGDCLYLWDLRRLDTILGGCAKAWAGLSRAVKLDAADSAIVTASPDGLIRYWSF